MPTLGELCAGGGMLTRALEDLFGATSVWHAETDAAAAKVLEAHWPGVPNLGDIANPPGGPYGVPRRRLNAPRRARQAAKRHARRVAGWQAMARPVDIYGAGFPCQPFSVSGKRGGSADERHLWPTGVLPGIEALMPPVVVLENVPNLLRIERGEVFGVVLADLDRLGYAVAWTTVGACKVGACHHRHRLFVLAVRKGDVVVPSVEPFGERHGNEWLPPQRALFGEVASVRWPSSGVSREGVVWALPVQTCGADGAVLPTPTARIADRRGTPSAETAPHRMASGRRNLEDAVALLPTPRVAASRTGRSAILGSSSSPSIDQALEIARGELPRELASWDEAPPSWLPTPRASDTGTAGRRASEGWRPPLSQVLLPMFPTPTARDATRGAGRRSPEGRPLSEVVALLPPPTTSDANGVGVHGSGGRDLRTAVAEVASDARGVTMMPTPRASDATKGGPNQRGSAGDLMLPSAVQPGVFGQYESAVRRQESAFGFAAPEPTELGRNGSPRLAAAFPEWMMGNPPGWITDLVGSGLISRNDAIRIAGNGVVEQTVVYALPTLPTFPAALSLLARESLGVAA